LQENRDGIVLRVIRKEAQDGVNPNSKAGRMMDLLGDSHRRSMPKVEYVLPQDKRTHCKGYVALGVRCVMTVAHATSIISYKATGDDPNGHVYDEVNYVDGNLLLYIFLVMAVPWELLG
jgi:hypothetical protein